MAEPKPRVFEYDVSYDGEGRATAQDSTIDIPQEWAPEHLVLAGLVDCSVTSLRHHAKREGIEVQASGYARGTVTRHPEHGRFAFVEIEVRLNVTLTPRLLRPRQPCSRRPSATASSALRSPRSLCTSGT